MTDLAIIIPSRDRPASLEDCLRTLTQQLTESTIDVLVVDDGSTLPLAPIVARFRAPRMTFRTLTVPSGGLNVARNLGVNSTDAPVVALLDDDTLVEPHWAEAVIDAFRSLDCAGLAGRILLEYEGPRPAWLSVDEHGYLSGFDRGADRVVLTDGSVPVGANCAVKREWFDRVNGFTAGLDRGGHAVLMSGGDTDFFRRIVAAGGAIAYSPLALVRHRIPASRLTMRYFLRRAFSQGMSDSLMEGRPRTAPEHARWWWHTIYAIARIPPIVAKNIMLRRGPLPPTAWIARCAGRLASLKYWAVTGR
jgi:glycosyltransferase involved in cell wall biosynthesis